MQDRYRLVRDYNNIMLIASNMYKFNNSHPYRLQHIYIDSIMKLCIVDYN